MNRFVSDNTKTIALFINDFHPEYASALEKLSKRLGRPLQGITLIDRHVHAARRNEPDTEHIFKEIICDFSDDAALRKALAALESQLLLVVASFDQNQPYLQKVIPHVPYLLTPNEKSLEWATQKHAMRDMLAAYAPDIIPAVHVAYDASDATITDIVAKLQFPMIVKPTGLASSMLVNQVHNKTDLREILAYTFAVMANFYDEEAGRGVPEVIVEDFMTGDMYSIDLYLNEYGDAQCLPPIHPVTAHAVGKEGFYAYQTESVIDLDDTTIEAGQETAVRSAKALGLRSCVAHVELMLTPNGWKIIELGPRAGGYRQYMYETAYGIDHAYNELLIKIGLQPEIPDSPVVHCIVAKTCVDEEGIIETILGVEEVKQLKSVVKVDIQATPGDTVLPCSKGGRRVVDCYLQNSDVEQLYSDAKKLRELLVVKTKAKTLELAKSSR